MTDERVKIKIKFNQKSLGPNGFHPKVIKEFEDETVTQLSGIYIMSWVQRKAVME